MMKPPPQTTRIGRFDVPLRMGKWQMVIAFKNGYFAFWTAVFKKPVAGRKKIWGRAQVGLSAGDRFDRMKRECRAGWIPAEDRPEYKRMWEAMGRGANVKFVRPSTRAELKRWLDTHPVQEKQLLKN